MTRHVCGVLVAAGALAACEPTYECLDATGCDAGLTCVFGRCVRTGSAGSEETAVGEPDALTSAPDVPTITPVGPTITHLNAGGDHTCALFDDGRLICWGRRDYRQIGDGDPGAHVATAPVAVAGLDDVAQVTAGALHTCARTRGGDVFCWGLNAIHQCSSDSDVIVAVPRRVGLGGPAADVSTSYHATCAVLADDGSVWCWGFVLDGQAYQGGSGWRGHESPAPVEGLSGAPVRRVHVAGYSACAVHEDGAVSCWGANDSGQLANPAAGDASAGAVSATLPSDLVGIDPGIDHYCGVDGSHRVLCWGRNGLGATGAGPDVFASASAEPLAEPFGDAALAVDGGMHQSCARLAGGGVACWGVAGASGLLGLPVDGSAAGLHHLGPQMIVGLSDVRLLALGYRHACAVTGERGVTCWGSNDSAELGSGETSDGSRVPVAVDLTGALEP